MIARREWYAMPVNSSLNVDRNTAFIEVNAEALEKLLRAIQGCIEPAVQACQYDKAIDLISSYKDLEELLTALLSRDNEDVVHE